MEAIPNLTSELAAARAQTDSLFAVIQPDAFYDRPIAERHRIIFYLGHLEAFDWNQMRMSGMSEASPHASFDRLFEFGIDPEPGQLPGDVPSDWPSVAEVRSYNTRVREAVDRHIAQAPPEIAHMMLEHRHMHAETFAYLLHNLAQEKKNGPAPQLNGSKPVHPEMLHIPAGIATLGRKLEDGFGWDNEFSEFSVFVPEFTIGKYKVTNGEYLNFVRDGGPAPHYWTNRDGRWFYRGMFGDVPLPLEWPVYATLEQATGYAARLGASIPTEQQFHRAAHAVSEAANFDYQRWDPIAANASPSSASAFGAEQMIGNGWEWTSSVFAPFEGFAPLPTYPGYSANFFDGKHYVMKGASPRTAAKLARMSLRNWFRPDYPYVYGAFRIARNH
jgi:iron(II)-dependent oxidoreductase